MLPEVSVSGQIGTVGSTSHIQLLPQILRLLAEVPHEQMMPTSTPLVSGNSFIV